MRGRKEQTGKWREEGEGRHKERGDERGGGRREENGEREKGRRRREEGEQMREKKCKGRTPLFSLLSPPSSLPHPHSSSLLPPF